ncbi:hypothetical protein HID58_041251 [Brassica napus]|uniref:Uncharacterized protein n=1 Tax=Brassica napus TaxID=3708 RepID=A0ABQ8BBJ6_BRANA|nr:hypothetical protein HID58_041251 [Brassica napus]
MIKLQGAETDIVESFVIQNHTFVSILNKLVNGECSIVRLNDGVGDLRRRENRKGHHHTIHEHGARDVLASAGFVVIDVDPLELEIRFAAVLTGGVDGVLAADDFPELGTDLVSALASLDVKDFSHFLSRCFFSRKCGKIWRLPSSLFRF